MYGNNQFMLDNLNRQRERIDDMIKNYQSIPQTPINNFISTNSQTPTNMYELKKLNDGDEVENIAILNNSIFLGDDKMQIKKLDGTIEKYEIKKVYPRDKKDDKIDELNKKIKELEMKLDEHRTDNEPSETIKSSTKQGQDDRLNAKSKSKTTGK